MTIKRGPKPERGFTIITNQALRDRSLSFRARGVLGYVLSNVEGWETNAEAISRMGTEGRDAIRTALNELEAAGYLSRTVSRGTDGRWITDWVMYETPQEADKAAGEDRGGFSATDNPRRETSDGSPATVSQALKAEDHQEDHQEDSHLASLGGDAPAAPTLLDLDPEPPKPKPKKRATSVPAGFVPNDTHRAIAAERHLDLRHEWLKMSDWAQAKGQTYLDWDAAFRSWLRKATPDHPAYGSRQDARAAVLRTLEEKAGLVPDGTVIDINRKAIGS